MALQPLFIRGWKQLSAYPKLSTNNMMTIDEQIKEVIDLHDQYAEV